MGPQQVNRGGKDFKDTNTIYRASQLKMESTSIGNLVWVIHDHVWWPAQVVDENSVSEKNRIKKITEGAILVRLYGSYDYLYVDPMTYHSEFENILKQNNNSLKEIFQKSLKQDICQIKSGARSEKKVSRSKGKDEASNDKRSNHVEGSKDKRSNYVEASNGVKKNLKHKSSSGKDRAEASKDKSLNQDGSKKNQKRISSLGKDGADTSKGKSITQIGVKKNRKADKQVEDALEKTDNSGVRRLRVMQILGLVAPSESPFCVKRPRITLVSSVG